MGLYKIKRRSKMKKAYFVFLVSALCLAVLMASFLTACTPESVTSTATATSTATSTQTTTATSTTTATTIIKPIELKWTSQWVPGSDDVEADLILARMLNERTGGRVHATYYGSESLGKTADWINMLNGGVAQMGSIMLGTYPGTFDLELITDLPMLGIPDRNACIDVLWELYNKGYLKGFSNFKVMGFKGGTPLSQFFGSKKVQTLEDYKGLKMRGSSAPFNAFYSKLGASAVAVTGPEIYMSMDRGVIDGFSTAWSYVVQVKLYEVAKYCIWSPAIGIGSPSIVMSKQIWDSIPADIQKIIDQVIIDYKSELKKYYEAKDKVGPETLQKNGIEVYNLSDSEAARFKQIAASVADTWIAEREAKGLPAKAAYETSQQFLAKLK
jgi:TRAP-type transport system periplasmic protein